MQRNINRWVFVGLMLICGARFALSLTDYNNDVRNHIAWMDNVKELGWQGLYERNLEPWAGVNYPPLTLYSFWLAEKIFAYLPADWQTFAVYTSLYKLPSILADCLIAWLIWRFAPFKSKWKLVSMAGFLLNPALAYNSLWWGQIESLVTLFSIATILLLIHGRPAHALIVFAVALLFKQNALPLAPLVLVGLIREKLSLKSAVGAAMVIMSLIYFAYEPLTPAGISPIVYGITSYLSSIGGQVHQHQASVNAFNLWYLLGQNLRPDQILALNLVSYRLLGILFTVMGLAGAYYLFKKKEYSKYQQYWVAAAVISLSVFLFSTRMHERHGFMMIAYLTMLLPYMKYRCPYYLLSLISFYNLYAVWSETLYYGNGIVWWEIFSRGISAISVISLLAAPLWLLPKGSRTA